MIQLSDRLLERQMHLDLVAARVCVRADRDRVFSPVGGGLDGLMAAFVRATAHTGTLYRWSRG